MVKVILKKAGIGLAVLLGVIAMFLLVLTIVHRISLAAERDEITPNGRVVEVNGRSMHIYVEGDNENAPLLIFLSGSGTSAPVYDFKPLYSLLSDDFRIAVVEKIGYGYSEIADVPRDIDTILSETRAALSAAGESGPYVLLPHSMSGLEALRWAQLYPDEVAGIIGIDMAITSVYIDGVVESSSFQITVLSALAQIGGTRLLPVNGLSLTTDEHKQAKLLLYRNTLNKTVRNEIGNVLDNANVVKGGGIPDVPLLLLVSDGKEIAGSWITYQEEFAKQNNAKIEYFNCGHYIHQYEPERIAALCRDFMSGFQKQRI
jgi:pimeloyl-ACP methyl ester carboxylesterase